MLTAIIRSLRRLFVLLALAFPVFVSNQGLHKRINLCCVVVLPTAAALFCGSFNRVEQSFAWIGASSDYRSKWINTLGIVTTNAQTG